jgi:dihydropteroate synthase
MAIVNATPDSFSDGGGLPRDEPTLRRHIEGLLAEGADVLDVGGESTRPGHAAVPAPAEWARIEPVLAAIRRVDDEVLVSVDTRKAEVARRALAAGADFVNDVGGLVADLAGVVAEAGCSVVLMRAQPLGADLLGDCARQLAALMAKAHDAGIPEARLLLDPGLGFGDPPGSDVLANLALVRGVNQYAAGRPVLIGASRKRFIGAATGVSEAARRVHGSVGVAMLAALSGATSCTCA